MWSTKVQLTFLRATVIDADVAVTVVIAAAVVVFVVVVVHIVVVALLVVSDHILFSCGQ